ncbi:MAG: serine/threonine-protein phosphatase [Anaerolineae bacterium]|nr:serine/threonine-protein phosphatase [Anaerolineae bacterium]
MTIEKSAATNEPEDNGIEQTSEAAVTPEQNLDENTPDAPLSGEHDMAQDDDPKTTAPLARNSFVKVAEVAKTRPIITKPTEPLLDDEPAMQAGIRCHVGARRERNEDSCFSFVSEVGGHFKMQPFGLFIVADGMGGHADGHLASKIASRTAAHHIIDRLYLPLLEDNERVMQTPIQEVLETAVQRANRAVYEYDPEMDSGTTLTIALILGRRLHVAHVGDSRLYMYANDKLEPITIDHSLVQRLQDVGQLTAEEATFYRYGHILLRAVGQSEEVEVDTYMRLLPKSGILMLCSDGVSGFISDAEIAEILKQDASVNTIADGIFSAAMSVGGFDNITAVVIEFKL